jgi:hypothetical protein
MEYTSENLKKILCGGGSYYRHLAEEILKDLSIADLTKLGTLSKSCANDDIRLKLMKKKIDQIDNDIIRLAMKSSTRSPDIDAYISSLPTKKLKYKASVAYFNLLSDLTSVTKNESDDESDNEIDFDEIAIEKQKLNIPRMIPFEVLKSLIENYVVGGSRYHPMSLVRMVLEGLQYRYMVLSQQPGFDDDMRMQFNSTVAIPTYLDISNLIIKFHNDDIIEWFSDFFDILSFNNEYDENVLDIDFIEFEYLFFDILVQRFSNVSDQFTTLQTKDAYFKILNKITELLKEYKSINKNSHLGDIFQDLTTPDIGDLVTPTVASSDEESETEQEEEEEETSDNEGSEGLRRGRLYL